MTSETLDISEARKHFTTLDQRLRKQHVITITRHNKAAFAVIDIDYLQAVMETLEILADPQALQMLQESIADIRAGRLHDHQDVKKDLL